MSPELTLDIPPDHPAFAGHFPGRPLLPGALLLDEVLRRLPLAAGAPLRVPVAKFSGAALPGEALQLRHTRDASGALRFELRAAQRLVLSGTVLAEHGPARPA